MKFDGHKLFSTSIFVSIIVGLLLFSLVPQQPIHERVTLFERVATALILLLIILLIDKKKAKEFFIPVPLVFLLVVIFISILQMPSMQIFMDAAAFLLLTIFAILTASSFQIKTTINGVAFASVLLILFTTIFIIFMPEIAFDQYGQLKGAFYGTNTLAISLVLLSPALMTLQLSNKKATHYLRGVLLSSTFALIYLSTSQTSLIVFVLIIFVRLGLWVFEKNQKVGLIFSLIFLGTIVLATTNFNFFLTFLGKSADLSGRVPLWEAYLKAISLKPFEGYGWHLQTTTTMPLGEYIFSETGFSFNNAHNDLMNWWATTGIIGLTLILVTFVLLFINVVRLGLFDPFGKWIFLTGIVLFIVGLTEHSTMHPDGWLLLNLAFTTSAILILPNKTTWSEGLKTGIFATRR